MLKLYSVSIKFQGQSGFLCPVDHVTLEVKDGERHVIIGETGSGKSVLLMAILGLSKGEVTGNILWNGKDLIDFSQKEYAKIRGSEIAYIPQGNAKGMDPLMRIGDQISEMLRVHRKFKRKEAWEQVVDVLGRLDFESPGMWARQYPHRLSGGMKQRALVAMGILAGGQLLLADEPTKGLDEARRYEIEKLFVRLSGASLLCVTHDLSFAQAVGEKISVMYAGQILESCNKYEFFRDPWHPYSQIMIGSLPENGFQFPEGFAPSHETYGNLGCRFADRCFKADEKCRQCPPVKQVGERQVRCWYAGRDT